jgi:hypothetical protein
MGKEMKIEYIMFTIDHLTQRRDKRKITQVDSLDWWKERTTSEDPEIMRLNLCWGSFFRILDTRLSRGDYQIL